ncbi:hypothetical protein ACSQ67_017107 [Phaseolus vulgaris]
MIDGYDEAVVVSTNSEPFFVRRLLKEALGNDINDLKLLVFTVHRVVLEYGFVRIDKDSSTAISCFHSLDDSPSPFSSMKSLRYTLPRILVDGGSHSVNLKFRYIGTFCECLRGLSDDSSSRPLKLMVANGESKGSDGKEVFYMLKMVKDRVALPLLIDVCEKGGLDLPPCFVKLPMELKGLILECVPDVDLGKVACTCSKLRFMCSNNESLKKFLEEFREESREFDFKKLQVFFHNMEQKNRKAPFQGQSCLLQATSRLSLMFVDFGLRDV